MRKPASAGPITRVALNRVEFKAMALGRSALPTNSTIKAWRTGISKAITVPDKKTMIHRSQTLMTSSSTSTPRTTARTISEAWVMKSRRSLEVWSATTPPKKEKSSTGRVCKAPMTPRKNEELVSSRTSQPKATDCIQEPVREIIWPV